jgi:tetratricopeptide (TPR) repeat protein
MSYSVQADAASKFAGRLYDGILSGKTLSKAVALARRHLHAEPKRKSVLGELPIQDWMVPILHLQIGGYTPVTGKLRKTFSRKRKETRVSLQEVCNRFPEGEYGFFGRDQEILEIERAFRNQDIPVLSITGVAGTGKTELAKGFSRWFAETGGCPGGAFLVDFKSKADFSQIVAGIMGHGTNFSALSDDEQFAAILEHLRTNACLLVLDNFETVSGYPSPAHAFASSQEMARIARFLSALKGGRSRVIITSRKENENWLAVQYKILRLTGLNQWDAAQMALFILRAVGKEVKELRSDMNYPRLLTSLRGHPRCLAAVLPLLRQKTSEAILADLEQNSRLPVEQLLDASTSYALKHLSEHTGRLLPLLGLFSGYVSADVLAGYTSDATEKYSDWFGAPADAGEWQTALEEAAAAGLLRSLDFGGFEMHPALPPLFRDLLQATQGISVLRALESFFVRFCGELASVLFIEAGKCEPHALNFLMLHEATLLRALRVAESAGDWADTQQLLQALHELYEIQDRISEGRSLNSSLLDRIGKQRPSIEDRDRGNLWLYALGYEAVSLMERNQLQEAESAYNESLNYLISLNDSASEPKVALCYHQLGRVAEERSDFAYAEEWYRKALEIRKRLGREREVADTCHNLGGAAVGRSNLPEAEQWFRKALEIYEQSGLEREAARTCHQLGGMEQKRSNFLGAKAWYAKALEIRERVGPDKDAADTYHDMGNLAFRQYDFRGAEPSYRKALEIYETLGRKRDAADTYHNLGNTALQLSDLAGAEAWYRRAMRIYQHLGLEKEAAHSYHQLGSVALEHLNFAAARRWYQKARKIYEVLGLASYSAYTYHQLGRIHEEESDFGRAKRWYKKAAEVHRRLGQEREMAGCYHSLGTVALERVDFAQAETWYRRALKIYERLGLDGDAAGTYYQLGRLALEQSDFTEAEDWYYKAIKICERLKIEGHAADAYHQLGRVLEERSDFKGAETWYRKALETRKRLGLERDTADTYHSLGNLAVRQSDFDTARKSYEKALKIRKHLGMERDTADTHYALGNMAFFQNDSAGAEQCYKKALKIYKKLGMEKDTADIYHNLGNAELQRSEFAAANECYEKALKICERLGLRKDTAETYHNLGHMAQLQRNFDQAQKAFLKALDIYTRLFHAPFRVNTLVQLAGVSHEMGRLEDAAGWCAEAFVIAQLYEMPQQSLVLEKSISLVHQMGEDAFVTAWRNRVPGVEPPIKDLRSLLAAHNEADAP